VGHWRDGNQQRRRMARKLERDSDIFCVAIIPKHELIIEQNCSNPNVFEDGKAWLEEKTPMDVDV
jgi:hypothetical protein